MKPIRWVRRGFVLLGAGAAAGALVVATRHVLDTPQPLESGLPGEARIDRDHGGELYYTVAGPDEAHPIVLLHDLYPGASSYAYGAVVARLARTHRVYAPDWLGFGMSEHPALAYTGEFYANMLAGYLRDVIARPATVVAIGRAANIAARAASDAPALFERLVLVSPYIAAGIHLNPTLTQALVRLAERTSLGLLPYAILSSRLMLRRHAMRRGLGAATEDALDHEWAAAHQFGARYAMLATLTGELDLPVQHVLTLLEPPMLLVAGEDDRHRTRDDMEDLAALNLHADLDVIPGAGAAVCQDQPARFAAALTLWMQRELPRHVSSDTVHMGSPATLTQAPRSSISTRPASNGNGTSTMRVAPAPQNAVDLRATAIAKRAGTGPAKPQQELTPTSPAHQDMLADGVNESRATKQATSKNAATSQKPRREPEIEPPAQSPKGAMTPEPPTRTASRSQSKRPDVSRPERAAASGPRADAKETPGKTEGESRMSRRAPSPPTPSARRTSKPKAETSSDVQGELGASSPKSQSQRTSPGRDRARNGTQPHRTRKRRTTPEMEA